MNKTILSFLLVLLTTAGLRAQTLQTFQVSMSTTAISYLSIGGKTVYSADAAAAAKASLDLALVPGKDGFGTTLEWYNLTGKDEKLPEAVLGTATRILAMTFDRSQFDRCKTSEDLKRMTGYVSQNSLSHFAVVDNGKQVSQHCFLFEREGGKRGLLYVEDAGEGKVKLWVKTE